MSPPEARSQNSDAMMLVTASPTPSSTMNTPMERHSTGPSATRTSMAL